MRAAYALFFLYYCYPGAIPSLLRTQAVIAQAIKCRYILRKGKALSSDIFDVITYLTPLSLVLSYPSSKSVVPVLGTGVNY